MGAAMTILPPELFSPGELVFGRGSVLDLLKRGARFGQRAVIVHGRSLEASGKLRALIAAAPPALRLAAWRASGGEPTLEQLRALLTFARECGAEWIAGIGGGTAMDLAKACAALVKADLDVGAYHDGAAFPAAGLPFLAAPTTAGSGSEASMVSVLTNTATGVKKSMRSPTMIARIVALDPALLEGSPPHVIAHSGMDALTQAVESYLSRKSVWLSEVMALRAVELVNDSLEAVYADSASPRAGDLLTGSYLAGYALAFSRLGVVHGLAHPLGCRYELPHGLVCGVCLPVALRFNREVVGPKYDALSRAVGADLRARVELLLERFGMRSPFAGRPVPEDAGLIEEILASGSTAANPRPVSAEDARALLRELFAGPQA